jgi:mannose-6-phosphate isomerase-like protein (cupin superfamily)
VYLRSADVTSAFARGVPLLENASFKVHASRREKPGDAEVHASETDIFYVLEGAATLVTGGALVDERMTGPGELRAPSIRGGATHQLAPGDFVVVPKGQPHWFKDVKGTLLYYTVKVIG